MSVPEMIVVDWTDAVFAAHEPPTPLHLRTIGFLHTYNDEYLTVAMETREDRDEWRDYVTIPLNYIRRITYLCPRSESNEPTRVLRRWDGSDGSSDVMKTSDLDSLSLMRPSM